MSGFIIICPVGFVDEDILSRVTACIEMRCGVACKTSIGIDNPNYAYDDKRNQYNSKLILGHLMKCCPHDAIRFMGVTSVDLFVPILKFVFGIAQIEGRCSVISTYRLRPEFHGMRSDRNLFMARIEKTAVHELGHCFSLTHCRDRRCVMYSSTRIEDTDFKEKNFCPTCAELFRWHLEKIVAQPPL